MMNAKIIPLAGVVAAAVALGLARRAAPPASSVSEDASRPETPAQIAGWETRLVKRRLARDARVAAHFSSPASAAVAEALRAEAEAAEKASDPERLDLALTDLVLALASSQPPEAARGAAAIRDPELRAEAMALVARLWAARDPGAAMAWAARLASAEERETAATHVSLRVAEQDPAAAFRWRASQCRDGESHSNLENLAARWAEKDPAAALAWVSERSHGAQREALMAQLAFAAADTAPREAARLVVQEIPPGEMQNEAVMSVLHRWARRDPGAATAWVQQFPAGPLRERATRELRSLVDRRLSAR